MHHPKRQLFVDTFQLPQPGGKKKAPSKIKSTKKPSPPEKPAAKRTPLTPEARREKQRTQHKEKQERLKSLGLCRHCPKPAIEGQTRCETCAEVHRVSRRKNDARRWTKAKQSKDLARATALEEKIAAGGPTKCRNCKNPPIPGQTRCKRCADKHRLSRRKSDAARRSRKAAEKHRFN